MRLIRITHSSFAIIALLSLTVSLTGCNMFSSSANAASTNPSTSAYSVSGTISPGSNAAGATVTLSGPMTATSTANSSGQFSFKGLSTGSYTVTPSKSGYSFTPETKTFPVGANVTGISFTISRLSSFSVSGTISPVSFGSGATVSLSGDMQDEVTADAEGNFTFSNLPNGSYTVTPKKSGFNFSPANQAAKVSNGNVGGLNFSSKFSGSCLNGGGSANYYVATYGNDSWSGTLDCPNAGNTDGPFASVARAQEAVRSINGKATSPITVMLREGTYYLPLSPTNPGTLNFTSSDSGTSSAPIIWQNYPSETPVLNGGLPVTGWQHVSGALWQTSIPVGTQPFEYLFYNGERRLRSRLASSAGVGYYMHGGSCISTQSNQTVSMDQCNLGTFLRIAATIAPNGANANCPYVSSGGQSKCLDRFQYNPADPITHWINLNPAQGNPCKVAPSGGYPAGDIELTLIDAYSVDMMRISCVDTTNHVIYLTGATQGESGSYAFFGPTAGHRYFVENTRDAFNSAQAAGQTGLWFLDRSTTPWTLNYLANETENPQTDTIVIPQLGGAIPGAPATDYIGASLLLASKLQYVTFNGLTFEMDDFIPSSTGVNNDNSEEFAIPQAIDCESCQNVTFDGISVRHTSGSALLIAGSGGTSGSPAANDTVQNSAFYDLGSSGVRIGRSPSGADRAAYVAQFITVQNNLMQGYSRVFADGEGVAMGSGHDITIQHNDINDGYHAGIGICDFGCYSFMWSANGTNIVSQYNHIWNVMQGVTSDGGALYYNIGGAQGSGTGNQILNNLIHDVTDAGIIDQGVTTGSGYGGHGIYLDMQSAGVEVANNVIYRVGAAGFVMTQGPAASESADTYTNNIVAYARRAVYEEQNPWPQNCTNTLRVNVTHNLFYFDLDETKGFHALNSCADSCGMAFNQFQNFQGNLYWRTDGGFAGDSNAFFVLTTPPPPGQASTCAQLQNPPATMMTFSQWQTGTPLVNGVPIQMNEDLTGTVSVNPGFGSTGQAADFLLTNTPVPGFNVTQTNETINSAGRNNPLITVPPVPGTVPTYVYSAF